MNRSVITQEQRDKMVSDYLLGKSSIQAAKQFGLSSECCTRELLKRGIQPRGYYKYKINHDIFETIDSEEKAYWLGFIVADGNISKDMLSISLKWSDLPHLEKFKKFCASEHPIRFVETVVGDKTHQKCRIDIGNKKIVSDLLKLGVTPRKTFTYQCDLSFLPESLVRHFWRGVFDGDGCIAKTCENKRGRKGIKWQAMLTGNQFVLDKYDRFIKSYIKTESTVKLNSNASGKTYYHSVGGIEKIQDYLKVLYRDATIYLDRKYDLYLECLEQKIVRKNRDSLTEDEISSLYLSHGSWDRAAKSIGTSTGGLYKIRRRLGMV